MSGKLLILGGTTEGRKLAETLSRRGYEVTVSVATDYGEELLRGLDVRTLVGRMNREEMEEHFARNGYVQILDATHPYAVIVSQNAQAAARACGLPYRRLVRPEGASGDWWQSVPDIPAAVEALRSLEGNILLTTGSKDLAAFTAVEGYRERIWPRILASQDSLGLALEAGFASSHIIAMQGPFSVELNEALIHQFHIGILVTKRSGRAGGFAEKAEAVQRTGIKMLVVERPSTERGETMEELLSTLRGEREL